MIAFTGNINAIVHSSSFSKTRSWYYCASWCSPCFLFGHSLFPKLILFQRNFSSFPSCSSTHSIGDCASSLSITTAPPFAKSLFERINSVEDLRIPFSWYARSNSNATSKFGGESLLNNYFHSSPSRYIFPFAINKRS